MNVEYDLVRAYFEENGFWVRAKEISTEIGKNRFLFPIFEIFNSENSADFIRRVSGSLRVMLQSILLL